MDELNRKGRRKPWQAFPAALAVSASSILSADAPQRNPSLPQKLIGRATDQCGVFTPMSSRNRRRRRRPISRSDATPELVADLVSAINGQPLALAYRLAELAYAGKVDLLKTCKVLRRIDIRGMKSLIESAHNPPPPSAATRKQSGIEIRPPRETHIIARKAANDDLESYRASADPAAAIRRRVLSARSTR